MATQLRKVRIFVASPVDVQSERDQLFKVVNELNLTLSTLAPEKGIVLELVRWETHVHPGLGIDAQQVVNEQIGDYDVFVGIMWKRMGTPTTTSQSGTDEEFQRAYRKWQENKSLPVLFYFCQQSFPPPRGAEDVEQLGKVVAFRNELSTKGLVADYEDHESFADVVRPHLLLVLGKMFSSKGSTMEAAQRAGEITGTAELAAARSQIVALANQYEDTRRTMVSGDARTRQMEIVASRMRSLALPAYPLLADLVGSESPGQRLAAISILEGIPTPAYLPWLADRVASETPFVAYHAIVALLNAARNLRSSNSKDVEEAIRRAWEHLNKLPWKDPNQIKVLQNAEHELRWTKDPS
jgi:Domain of unknown function (DUF4062)